MSRTQGWFIIAILAGIAANTSKNKYVVLAYLLIGFISWGLTFFVEDK